MTKSEVMLLEILIDQYSLEDILDALSEICAEKFYHIQTNYQDDNFAEVWNEMSSLLSSQSNVARREGI